MELISKKSVIRILNEEPSYSDVVNVLTELEDKVNALPTIEEHRTGRWIKHTLWSEGCGMGESYGYYYMCSECGKEVRGGYKKCSNNYCPNCGAKMERSEM